MNPLLNQFLSEARDFLQAIGEHLLRLEETPGDGALMDELFRLVHTLKGNSGLFDLPEMTRVLHAAEDLMDAVRDGRLAFSRALADRLLEAMDFISLLIEALGATADGQPPSTSAHAREAVRLGEALRGMLGGSAQPPAASRQPEDAQLTPTNLLLETGSWELEAGGWRLEAVPAPLRMAIYRRLCAGETFCWLVYAPEEECFYKGEDPFFQVIQLAAPLWRRVSAREDWPRPAELDAYRCLLRFEAILSAEPASLAEHFRYVLDQVEITPLTAGMLQVPTGRDQADWTPTPASGPSVQPPAITPEINPESLWSFQVVLEAQRAILSLSDSPPWLTGRLRAVASSLAGAFTSLGRKAALPGLEKALETAIAAHAPAALIDWLDRQPLPAPPPTLAEVPPAPVADTTAPATRAPEPAMPNAGHTMPPATPPPPDEEPIKFGRRAEDQLTSPRTLKVDQAKIDRLMNLIGEMVVAKNALPYLAARAETVFGVRELAREIKGQHGVINRIAEEMQDAIMQVRLLPVSFVFQRFPRLVRDLAHKLGKEVRLVMEGEATEADKNIIEALADPLIHLVRNSLDHGLETPEERRAAGKPAEGRLTIAARQESDRVLIEISDDGRGIDPAVIRRKAYEKGIIDETALERLGDQEAINLVFAAGFSTAAQVTDLSGRGVGMDVVRDAIARVNGAIELRSQVGQGTQVRLALPLSMAVSNVMIIESAGQRFGVPMESVAETVRVPERAIRTIKRQRTTVLRGRLVPLVALNELLALDAPQIPNDDQEFAVLVVRIDQDDLGIIVDDCRETVDIILKPLAGFLGTLAGYAGSALLGDGSVLLVLNPRGLL